MVYNFPSRDTSVVQANLSWVTGGLLANGQVWNVTNPVSATKVQPLSFTQNGNANWGIKMPGDSAQKIAIFQLDNAASPNLLGSIPNQNLRALESIDYVIVSPEHLLSEAKRLAEFHNRNSDLRTMAVDIKKIYNEFSSGVQDITAIKDFLRPVSYTHLTLPTTD